MNAHSPTTETANAAMPSDMRALIPLEDPINRVLKFARLAKFLAETRDEDGTAEFREECARGLALLAVEIHTQIDAIDDIWLASWNAAGAAERGEAVR